jgi:phosphotransferase system HPr (HPr) family protein
MKKTTQTATHKKIAPDGPNKPTLRQTFAMTNRNGLHARPCALLVKTLRPFACEVKVEHDGATASGNSILGLMSLAVGFGSKLTFIINGSEAARAMAAVQQLFETQFEKAYAPENKVTAA